jgi:Glyoxalase-like domain
MLTLRFTAPDRPLLRNGSQATLDFLWMSRPLTPAARKPILWIMGYEIDHLFVLTHAGAPVAEALVRLGITEGRPNRHAGQGTANRRFFFDNAMLELCWVESEVEARSLPARPLRLADRAKERSTGACPFGICLRARDAATIVPPFHSFEYRPSFFHAGHVAHIAHHTPLSEPLWFFIARSPGADALPVEQRRPTTHRIGIANITEVTITLPQTPSTVTEAAAAASRVAVQIGGEHHLQIAFDGGRKGRVHHFGPGLPVEFRW